MTGLPWDRVRSELRAPDVAALVGLEKGKEQHKWGPCPFCGSSKSPALHVYPEPDGGFHCFSCGASGTVIDLAAEVWNISPSEACERLSRHSGILADDRSDPASPAGLTLADYADLFRLLIEDLRKAGLDDAIWNGRPAVSIPYRNGDGDVCATRFRIALYGDRFRWAKGSKPMLYGLPGLSVARRKRFVVLVEGESDVHVLNHNELPAVGVPGASTWKNEWAEQLEGIETVYLVAEPDQGGETLLRKVAGSPLAECVRVVRLEGAKDPAELYRRDMESFAERFDAALEEAQPLSVVAKVVGDRSWPAVKELPAERPEAPALPEHFLPAPLRPWCEDVAVRMQVPLEMVAIPALVGLASVVGRNVVVQPKRRDDWKVVPNLWGAVVALPGRMKSPALKEGLEPLEALEQEALEQFERESYSHAASLDALKAQEGALKGLLKQFYEKGRPVKHDGLDMDDTALKERLRDLKEKIGRLPSPLRFLTNDTTVEKLAELLRANPRGLLIKRDELAGWMKQLERDERRGDREFYLEGWNGNGRYTSDRIGRGTINVPALCISIIGGITPGKIGTYVEEALAGGYGADGLLQRFQLFVWPEDLRGWEHVDRVPDRRAQKVAQDVFRRLARISPEEEPRRFAPEAQELFDAWLGELERSLRSRELAAAPAFLAHLAKYRSLMPSLALLFHLSYDSKAPEITIHTAKLAAAWCEYLEAHARKVYAPELNAGITVARALGGRILDGDVEDRVTVRDIYRRGWSGLQTVDEARAALQVLEDIHWTRVEREGEGTNGRPSEVVRINPELLAQGFGGSVSDLAGPSENPRS